MSDADAAIAMARKTNILRKNDIGPSLYQYYVSRRFAEPLAKTHAAARATAVRRHHRDHGDNLGYGPLTRKRDRRLTSLALRACIPLSLSAVWPFSSWPRSNRRWWLWRSGQHFRKLAQARRPARPKMRRRWQSSEYASGSPHFL